MTIRITKVLLINFLTITAPHKQNLESSLKAAFTQPMQDINNYNKLCQEYNTLKQQYDTLKQQLVEAKAYNAARKLEGEQIELTQLNLLKQDLQRHEQSLAYYKNSCHNLTETNIANRRDFDQQIAELHNQIAELNNKLEQSKQQAEATKSQIAEQQKTISKLLNENTALKKQLNESNTNQQQLSSKNQSLESKLAQTLKEAQKKIEEFKKISKNQSKSNSDALFSSMEQSLDIERKKTAELTKQIAKLRKIAERNMQENQQLLEQNHRLAQANMFGKKSPQEIIGLLTKESWDSCLGLQKQLLEVLGTELVEKRKQPLFDTISNWANILPQQLHNTLQQQLQVKHEAISNETEVESNDSTSTTTHQSSI